VRAFDAQARFNATVALVVLADQLRPAGAEYHHVACADLHVALPSQRRVDLLAIERRAFGHRVLAQQADHVEDHAAGGDRRHGFDAELLQPAGGDEVAPLVQL
jgi:hypothetical protein